MQTLNVKNPVDSESSVDKNNPIWWKSLLAFILACSAYGAFFLHNKQSAQYQDRIVAITSGLPILVDRIRYRQESFSDMQPTVLWSGEGAKVLQVERFTNRLFFGIHSTEWTVLSKTASGRYFSVEYRLYRTDDCETPLACAHLQTFQGLNEKQARSKVFRTGNRALYRELFNEDMPPTEVKA